MDPGESPSAARRAGATGPRSKYAARACQECRRRRAKCDGQKPACARCLARGKPCIFTSEADNRGSAPKSYVALLQARIKLLEQVLWLHSIDVDASVAQLDAHWEEAGATATAPSAAYSSSLAFNEMCADLEGALYLDEPFCETEAPGSEARFFGATSGRLELQPSHGAPAGSADAGPSPGTDYQSPAGHGRHNHTVSEVECGSGAGLNDLVTPELRDRLMDLYFEWEQPWFQMVDEGLFRQSLRCGGPYSSTLLLCCILAIGSRHSDELEARTDPDDPHTAGRVFAERADLLLGVAIRSPSITTVQALGVLGVYHVAIGSDSIGWLYHGMATRLLLDMGLNLDSTTVTGTGALASEEVRLRRQIYWALYCNDKLWASYTGRICTMLDSQGAVLLPSPPPPLEPPGKDKSRSLAIFQRALATHCQILEKILTNLYAPKRLASASERRTFFDSCTLTLKGWFYSLPRELKARAADNPGLTPHSFILAMVYYTSVVLLAKPFLRPGAGDRPETGAPRFTDHNDVLRRASAACLEAAGEICLLGDKYREVFGSFRRSPLTATHCTLTAALVVMFVQPAEEGKAPARSSQLDCCLRTLRELSLSWGPPLRYWRTLNRILSGKPGHKSDENVSAAAVTEARKLGTRAPRVAENTDAGTDTGAAGGPGMPPLPVAQQAPAGYGALPAFSGEATVDVEALGVVMHAPHEPRGNNTTQLFAEVGYLNVGAFDALSWDHGDQDAADYHLWGPGNSW